MLWKSGLTWLLKTAKSGVVGSAAPFVKPGAVPRVSVHGNRNVLAGGGPALFSEAPLPIHRASTWYPLAVGSRIGPPVCLMSVVTCAVTPS